MEEKKEKSTRGIEKEKIAFNDEFPVPYAKRFSYLGDIYITYTFTKLHELLWQHQERKGKDGPLLQQFDTFEKPRTFL